MSIFELMQFFMYSIIIELKKSRPLTAKLILTSSELNQVEIVNYTPHPIYTKWMEISSQEIVQ